MSVAASLLDRLEGLGIYLVLTPDGPCAPGAKRRVPPGLLLELSANKEALVLELRRRFQTWTDWANGSPLSYAGLIQRLAEVRQHFIAALKNRETVNSTGSVMTPDGPGLQIGMRPGGGSYAVLLEQLIMSPGYVPICGFAAADVRPLRPADLQHPHFVALGLRQKRGEASLG